MQTFVLIIIVLIIVFLVCKGEGRNAKDISVSSSRGRRTKIEKLDYTLKKILRSAGYKAKYELSEHPTKSFSKNKNDLYVCTSCVPEDEEKLLYIALHEVAHTISPSFGKNSHDEKWQLVFKTLLKTAADLGYLDKERLR